MSGSSEFLYILIPIAIVVLLLKFCLIFCRAYYYQKRRERQAQMLQQQQRRMQAMASLRAELARANVVRITAPNRAPCTAGTTVMPTARVIRPTASANGLRTVIITSDQLRRALDPNCPPSYHQAITGQDKSVKVEEGTATLGSAAPMEPVVFDGSPPAYTPFSEPPSASSSLPSDVNGEGERLNEDDDDDQPLLT